MLVFDVGEISSIDEELEEAGFDEDDEEKLNILVKKGGLMPFICAELETGLKTAISLPSTTFVSSVIGVEAPTSGSVALLLGPS